MLKIYKDQTTEKDSMTTRYEIVTISHQASHSYTDLPKTIGMSQLDSA